MIRFIIISRHQTTINWLLNKLSCHAEVYQHLDEHVYASLHAGDKVIGNLPLEWIARLCQSGIEYWTVSLNYTNHAHLRGKELDIESFIALTPKVERYQLTRYQDKLF